MTFRKHKRILLFAILFFIFHVYAYCQNSHIPAIRGHYGFIIAHTKDLPDVSSTHPWGLELEWNWQLMSENAWNYCYCYPRTGISFFYINFDQPSILGNSYAPYVFIEPVLGAEKKFHMSFRFGMGPAFMDKVYDEQTNPENTFYGSWLSFIVLLNAGFNYRINDVMNIQLTANFNHISNGGIKNPNKGINFPTMGFGIDYNLRPMPYEKRVKNDSIDLHPKKWRFDVVAFATGKTEIKGHAHYPVYGLYGNVSRVIARLSALSLGLEGTVDLADKREIERLELMENGKYIDHKYAAALLGHELLIGRFIFSIRFGAYFYSPFKRMDPIYQRYGLTYHFNKRIFIGTDIKAHRQVADFLDFRLGISF